MITNERQYLNSRVQAEKFERAVEQARRAGPRPRVDKRIHDAMLEGMESDLDLLRRQLRRYERLKDGKVKSHKVTALTALPDALIEARIARNWTQKDLASRLGCAVQQVQRYENERYSKTSFHRIAQISDMLGVKLTADIRLPARGTAEKTARTKAASKTKRGSRKATKA